MTTNPTRAEHRHSTTNRRPLNMLVAYIYAHTSICMDMGRMCGGGGGLVVVQQYCREYSTAGSPYLYVIIKTLSAQSTHALIYGLAFIVIHTHTVLPGTRARLPAFSRSICRACVCVCVRMCVHVYKRSIAQKHIHTHTRTQSIESVRQHRQHYQPSELEIRSLAPRTRAPPPLPQWPCVCGSAYIFGGNDFNNRNSLRELASVRACVHVNTIPIDCRCNLAIQ